MSFEQRHHRVPELQAAAIGLDVLDGGLTEPGLDRGADSRTELIGVPREVPGVIGRGLGLEHPQARVVQAGEGRR